MRIKAPEHRAKATRVGVSQGQPGLQFDIDVLMLERRKPGFDQTQIPGHAQMADQGAHLSLDQQVLGAPINLHNALAGQADIQIFGNGPAQAAVAHDNAADALTFKMRRYATTGGFDFR